MYMIGDELPLNDEFKIVFIGTFYEDERLPQSILVQ